MLTKTLRVVFDTHKTRFLREDDHYVVVVNTIFGDYPLFHKVCSDRKQATACFTQALSKNFETFDIGGPSVVSRGNHA